MAGLWTLIVLTEGVEGSWEADDVIKIDIASIVKPSSFIGLWQMAAAASVVQRPVVSVHPNKGWSTFRSLNNPTLMPQQQQAPDPFFIMWTTTRGDEMVDDNWCANHFVPLLPLVSNKVKPVEVVQRSLNPVTGNFFFVRWQGEGFVARVEEVEEPGLILLSFMEKKDNCYTWPLKEDLSLEDEDVLIAPV
ncbi:hypothetical protein ElyMa_006593400 [Elysia marginata]|uniref:Uncharacterized protein n=1 Tax=Elysia marginata TaxID=1093978 RepID=A0AAV4IDW0_9GAST|nr:hypothetical protein ElyMa_006593400 [Elysia marginata]